MFNGLLTSFVCGISPDPSSLPLSGLSSFGKSLVRKVPMPIEHPMPAFFEALWSSIDLSRWRPSEKTMFSVGKREKRRVINTDEMK